MGDRPVAGDVDGDGRVDLIAFHDVSGMWAIRNSATGVVSPFGPWGGTGDMPFALDVAGAGYAQLSVWRPSAGQWYVAGIGGPYAVGSPGDIPVRLGS